MGVVVAHNLDDWNNSHQTASQPAIDKACGDILKKFGIVIPESIKLTLFIKEALKKMLTCTLEQQSIIHLKRCEVYFVYTWRDKLQKVAIAKELKRLIGSITTKKNKGVRKKKKEKKNTIVIVVKN
jgi:hypothetical protein